MNKYAFFSMDLESLYDSYILYNKGYYNEKYSYEEKMQEYLDLLDKYNVKATFFITLSSIDKCYDLINLAIKNGHEIALHGIDHKSPKDMTDSEFIANIRNAKKIIKDKFSIDVIGYRAPMFGIDDNKIELLKQEGFIYDSSNLSFDLAIKSGGIDLSKYEKIHDSIHKHDNFYEFSMSKVKAYAGFMPVSGGGYLRLVPSFVYYYYINKYLKKYDTYVFYCHPFELSYSPLPNIKELNLKEKMYLSIGRFNYLHKIEKIIKKLKRKKFNIINFSSFISEN